MASEPLLHLSARDVGGLLPPLREQIALVDAAYRAVRDGTADTPSTPELEPRPDAFVHPLPAYVADGDITALKWIAGFPANRSRGLPYLSSLIILNDSSTGLPLAIMDGAAITAARTAAVSMKCVERFAPAGWSTVCLVGYGVQARAHVDALLELNPRADIRVLTRHPDPDDERVAFTDAPGAARLDSHVVITGLPLGAGPAPPVSAAALAPEALILPLDDDASLAADVPNQAARFYVDDADDYRSRQERGIFRDWRQPDATVGEAVASAGRRPPGVVVCANQGMGILDALFADRVLAAARRAGAGTTLER